MDKRLFAISSVQSSCLQYQLRDYCHGFRQLGWDVEVFRERWPGENPIGGKAMVESILWFRPSIILGVDYARGQNPELFPLFSSFVCVVNDALPRFVAPAEAPRVAQAMQPNDIICTTFPGLAQRLIDQTFPADRVKHLPLAANEDMFHPLDIPQDEFTVAFPSNVAHPGFGDPAARYQYYTDPIRWLIEMGVKVKLYGEGWANEEFGAYWHGKVRNGPELNLAYNDCSAVAHINVDTGLHSRVFEASACGKPVLHRALPNDNHPVGIDSHGLPNVFKFHDKESLGKAIEIIKKADKDTMGNGRRTLLTLARGTIVSGDTFRHRAESIVRMVEEVQGE